MTGPVITVAIFDANEGTADMLETLLTQAGYHTVHGRLSGVTPAVEAGAFIAVHDPGVIVWDLSPPYQRNWAFFSAIRATGAFAGRGIVLTTTHMGTLESLVRSSAISVEMLTKPYHLSVMMAAVRNTRPQPYSTAEMS